MLKLNTFIYIVMLLFLSACQQDNQDSESKLIVSAAASLTDVLEEVTEAFNEEYPDIKITFNFGGSGNLSQQIQQGAPADVFLSASEKDMDALSEKELILEDSRFPFAKNEVVIIAGADDEHTLQDIKDIGNIKFHTIMMGDVESVPVGRYGKESLENAGVWDAIEEKVVYVSDVRQALTQVETGNAELAIVYHTDALTSDKVKILHPIDPELHRPITYPAAIIQGTEQLELAKKFLDFLKTKKAEEIFQSYGFQV